MSLEVFSRIVQAHAVCGMVQRRFDALAPEGARAQADALCGAAVILPIERTVGQPKCAACVREAAVHRITCDCWRLWTAPGRQAS